MEKVCRGVDGVNHGESWSVLEIVETVEIVEMLFRRCLGSDFWGFKSKNLHQLHKKMAISLADVGKL